MSTSDLAIQFWEGKSYGRALKLEPAWIALTRVIEQNQGSYLKRAMAEVERIQTVQRVCPGSDLGMKIAMSTQHPRRTGGPPLRRIEAGGAASTASNEPPTRGEGGDRFRSSDEEANAFAVVSKERGDFDPPYGRSLAPDVMWAKHPAFPTFAVTRTPTTPSPSV